MPLTDDLPSYTTTRPTRAARITAVAPHRGCITLALPTGDREFHVGLSWYDDQYPEAGDWYVEHPDGSASATSHVIFCGCYRHDLVVTVALAPLPQAGRTDPPRVPRYPAPETGTAEPTDGFAPSAA